VFELASLVRQSAALAAVLMFITWPASAELRVGQTQFDQSAIESLIDPTRPAGWARQSPVRQASIKPEFRIDYIIHSSQRRLVSINGKTAVEGDRLQGVKVLRIDPKQVLLSWQGKQWFAKVNPGRAVGKQRLSVRRSP